MTRTRTPSSPSPGPVPGSDAGPGLQRCAAGRRAMVMGAAASTWLAALAGPRSALAQPVTAQPAWPSRPVSVVVPFPAGGASDGVARLIADRVGHKLGQTVWVDNRPGISGVVGSEIVARAAPDGYTLIVSLSTAMLTNQFLFRKLSYDPQRDFELVSLIAFAPAVLVVHPSVPAADFSELQKWLSENKEKVKYGSWGVGSVAHLAGSHMGRVTGADMDHVPYRGEATMVQDLVSGQLQMAFASANAVRPFIEPGKLKALGVTGERAMRVLPQVKPIVDQGITDEVYRLSGWIGLAAPKKTPPEIVQKLSDEVGAVIRQSDVIDRITSYGFDPVGRGPELFRAQYEKELPVWKALVYASGATLE